MTTIPGVRRAIGLRELKTHASRIVREVRAEQRAVDITVRGVVVARLVPVRGPGSDSAPGWSELDALAAEIGRAWPSAVTAAEAVAEQRRAP